MARCSNKSIYDKFTGFYLFQEHQGLRNCSGRHIIVNKEATLLDIAKILRKHFGVDYPFPQREAPKYLFWLISPMFGYTRKYVVRNVGIPITFDNSYSKSNLHMSYLTIEQTIKEHFQQIIDDGLLD